MKNFPPCAQISQACERYFHDFLSVSRCVILAVFAHTCVSSIYKALQIKSPSREPAVRPSRGRREALTTFQRGRRCNPTSAPLRPREGPVARRRPLFCAFRSVKKPRNFAVPMSRKALPASQALLSGSQRGLSAAAATTNKGLIAHGKAEKRRVRERGFCKKDSGMNRKYVII